MTTVPGIAISDISAAAGDGKTGLDELVDRAVGGIDARGVGGVVAATFSNPRRFPSLAVRVARMVGLPKSAPAFDIQMACSAYPYAVYLAGRMAADTGKPVLVVDGDAQTPLVDASDHATGNIFSDAATASLVSIEKGEESRFGFLSSYDEALTCPAAGPIAMDGFKVFSFVATEIVGFLRDFGTGFDIFAPHQANPYMIRQLAKSLGLSDKLATIPEDMKNAGSCSVAQALAACGRKGRALIAGFGAGFSAAAGIVRYR